MVAGSSTDGLRAELTDAFTKIKELSNCNLTAAGQKREEIKKLACIVQDVLLRMFEDHAASAHDRALLQAFSVDGTPISLTKRLTHRVRGKQMKRIGKSRTEYLVQVCFLRYIEESGESRSRFLTVPPMPLRKGLGGEAIFAASSRQFRTLRQLGHRGIAINAKIFDRKGFKKLRGLWGRHHRELEKQFGGSDEKSWVLGLMDWTLAIPCCLHDLHNALKWAIFDAFQDKELLSDTFIIFESLRNHFDDVQRHICLWLLGSVAEVEENTLPPANVLEEFYTALGLPEEAVRQYVEMRLWWDKDKDKLCVSKLWSSSGVNVMEELTGVVLELLKCQSFTESRWASIKGQAEQMIGGLATGLISLVKFVQEQPNMLKDYTHGFDRLKPAQIKFLITCMMVGKVVDRAMLLLMKDNRLAAVADDVEKAMEEQLDWLENCSLATWEMFAVLIGDGTSSRELRSICLRCAHIAVGFFHFRALRFVKNHHGPSHGEIKTKTSTSYSMVKSLPRRLLGRYGRSWVQG